jgi:hypothetical protein
MESMQNGKLWSNFIHPFAILFLLFRIQNENKNKLTFSDRVNARWIDVVERFFIRLQESTRTESCGSDGRFRFHMLLQNTKIQGRKTLHTFTFVYFTVDS